ncbi:MAG TPA: SpoIIIAH-like family protein [Limnochordia bacterium]|nr:SpoIIIAH-like family protein [Limnochordia bacterium]
MFYVIDRPMWQRGLLAILLILTVGVFYVLTKVQESTSPPGVGLVRIAQEAASSSGSVLVEWVDEAASGDGAAETDVATPDERFAQKVGTDPLNVAAAEVPVASEASDAPLLAAPATSESGAAPLLRPALDERSPRFDAFRIAKTTGRSRRIEALEKSLEREDLAPGEREAIRAEWLALVEREELERQAEGLLVARGLSDALVLLQEESAEVVVPEIIDQHEAGRIGDLIARIAGISLERITIVDGASAH